MDFEMRVMKKLSVIVWLLLSAFMCEAQLGGLKDRLVEKTKQAAQKAAKDRTTGAFDAERDKLDSTDFNYAITVIDNSGMLNIRDWDEAVTKSAYSASNMLLKEDKDITPAQKCRSVLDVAEKFFELRQYKPAEVSFLDAKLTYETEGLTNNINYSKVHADLGLLYANMGRFNTAEYYTSEALAIREQTLGKNSKAYASSLNNMAVLYNETGRYNESESFFSEAIQMVQAQLGANSLEYAIVLNNQAILFARIGRTEQAVEKLNEAIAIHDQLKKKSARTNVSFQSNLALLYQQQGKYTEAEAIYLKLEKTLGSKDPFYAGVLNNLALLYIQMNQLDKVEGYLKRSAEVYKLRFGAQNPSYAKVLNDLGNFYRTQGRFAEAEQNLMEAFTIRGSVLDSSHPDYVRSQEDLAILYWKKGDLSKADSNYKVAMEKSLDFINRYFPPMSEAEKTKYWDILQLRFQRFYNYCLDASTLNPDILQAMYDYQMATKGLLLNSTSKIKKAILASGNNELIRDYLAWLDKKETLARYYSLSRQDLTDQKIDLPSLEKEANDMERSLSQRSADFSQGYAAEKLSFKQVAAALGDAEAAVELIRIRTYDKDFTADSKYAALILTKTSTAPKLVILENGNQLETRYAKFYRNAIQQKSADGYSYDQFWARIDPTLAGKKVIYFSADGVYNQISLNTLKKPEGDYLLNKYDIIMVGNSKDIITLKTQKMNTGKKSAFLLGFPDYGGDAVPALPGTKLEVESITKILKTSGYNAILYMQKSATEAVIKSIQANSFVHIATHGYFQADVENDAVGVKQENAKNNPLLRSGLLLAGASPTMKGEVMPNLESNDNGVLTAYEAMNLSLEGTELIVLSACETGLGDVRAGEGVYGLQRAFLVAGANAIVMSMWKVDDAATQALMTNFYTNLAKGSNKAKAFKQAQLQLMTKFKEPYYWGAFVMMGM